MESQVDPFSVFPDDVRQDVDGLIWLGYLEDRVSWCGHDFVMRTLRGDEELLVALITKDYMETLGQIKAQAWATLGLAITSVDGMDDFCPQATPNQRDFARARFNWVSGNWYWPTAAHLYNRYIALLKRQQEALDALEDFCSRSLPMPTPSASSSIDRASLEPLEDIRQFLEPQGD